MEENNFCTFLKKIQGLIPGSIYWREKVDYLDELYRKYPDGTADGTTVFCRHYGASPAVPDGVAVDVFYNKSTNSWIPKYFESSLEGLLDAVNALGTEVSQALADLDNKVDKVEGKQLSTNDYTTGEKVDLGTHLTDTSRRHLTYLGGINVLVPDYDSITASGIYNIRRQVSGSGLSAVLNHSLLTVSSRERNGITVDGTVLRQTEISMDGIRTRTGTRTVVDDEDVWEWGAWQSYIPPLNYVLNQEQDTGRKWIDGSTIYQRTLAIPATAAGGISTINIGSVINVLVSIEGTVYLDTSGFIYSINSDSTRCYMADDGQTIYFKNFSGMDSGNGYVTIQYTKN